MTYDYLSRAQWRKSSYSGNSGNCVEVAITEEFIDVRDSKHPNGLALSFTPAEWDTFIRAVKGR
jgi:hypothetical protein